MQGKKYYQPKLFTTYNLADRIPEDNFYRRLKEILNLNFVRKSTASYYGQKGQQSIDPIVFFKLSLVGYMENICSDRKLVDHCAMRLDILYFLDYDIDEELPWHSTVSRTRKLFGEEIFTAVFQNVLKLCIDKGMVSGRRQAIDSALIKANASLDSLERKEILEDSKDYIKEVEQNNNPEKSDNPQPPKKKIGTYDTDKKLSNKTYTSTTDPDAKISYKPNKPRRLNYLSQVSVDIGSHVITHIQADFADKKDNECLPSILDKTRANLQLNGLKLEQVACDSNYSSADVLKYLDVNNITGYIPNTGTYKSSRKGFTYYPQGDYYKCSQGKDLVYSKMITKRNTEFKEYRSKVEDCKSCPVKQTCIGKSSQKQILNTIDKPYFEKMLDRVKTPYGKYLTKKRHATVEPVFGSLIEYGGMKKIMPKGISQANKNMTMAAVAYNLKKYMKTVTKKSKSKVIEREMKVVRELEYLYSNILLFLYNTIYNRASIQN